MPFIVLFVQRRYIAQHVLAITLLSVELWSTTWRCMWKLLLMRWHIIHGSVHGRQKEHVSELCLFMDVPVIYTMYTLRGTARMRDQKKLWERVIKLIDHNRWGGAFICWCVSFSVPFITAPGPPPPHVLTHCYYICIALLPFLWLLYGTGGKCKMCSRHNLWNITADGLYDLLPATSFFLTVQYSALIIIFPFVY